MALTKKNMPWSWDNNEPAKTSFWILKEAFTSATFLLHFHLDKAIIMQTDGSDFVSVNVLSQPDNQENLHPVTFFSKKEQSLVEFNYEIYDKDLLAIIWCFKEWCANVESVNKTIKGIADDRYLEYFMTTNLLNRQPARWSEFLSQFNFKIIYRLGTVR